MYGYTGVLMLILYRCVALGSNQFIIRGRVGIGAKLFFSQFDLSYIVFYESDIIFFLNQRDIYFF